MNSKINRLLRSAVLFGAFFIKLSPLEAGTWTEAAPLPVALQASAAATISNTIYVAGGLGASPAASLYAYNAVSNKWTTLASMPGPRQSGDGIGVISDKLYFVGGWTAVPPLPNNNLFIYDPAHNSWTSGANFPHLTGSGSCGVINGLLYVSSPNNGFSVPDQTELWMYNPVSNTWTAKANSPIAHVGPAAGVIGGKFYVAGGSSQGSWTAELDVYDPVLDKWSTNAPMPIALADCASAVLDGKLYVIGGYDVSVHATNIVEVFDPIAGTWAIEASMPTPRGGPCASVAKGVIYVLGGANGSVDVATNEAFESTSILNINMYAGLTISAPPGSTNEIDYKNNLNDPSWTVLTNLVLPTSPYLFIDTTSPYSSHRFYRTLLLP